MIQENYRKNIEIDMPATVRNIIKELENKGYEAYAVGGCVRDSILGKEPKDWDITTSAKPDQIKSIFRRTIDTGIQHGTVTVMVKGVGYEITTYRIDGEYGDGRHPKEVEFTSNIVEDLKRRDFTINAMAYNENDGVVDCFGGVEDLKDGIIRCVGNPEERFSEDALRMLRAVRFGAVLNFQIEEKTRDAIKKLAPSLIKISRERIQAELEKLIMSEYPERVVEIYSTGMMSWIFSKEEFTGDLSEGKSLGEALKTSPRDHYIRWAVVMSLISAQGILKSLKFDNRTIKICSQLVNNINMNIGDTEVEIRRQAVKVGSEIYGKYYLPYRRVMKNTDLSKIEKAGILYEKILERGDCLSTKDLKVKGMDLKEIGIEPGKKMGEIIDILFNMVLDDNSLNDRETLLKIAEKYT